MTLKRKKKEMAKRKPAVEKVSRLMQEDFRPRTKNQKNYIRTMAENQITMCSGPPGSGKTFCSVGLACEYLCNNRVEFLMFSRPIVNCGKGLGFLPGDITEKTQKYFQPVIDCLEFFLGREQYRNLVGNGYIKFEPLETMRGMSIKNTFFILDEASNAELTQLKMILSRYDHGSKFILNGDFNQTDLKYCDFYDVYDKCEKKRPEIEDLGFCKLDREDVQRPKIICDIMDTIEEQE